MHTVHVCAVVQFYPWFEMLSIYKFIHLVLYLLVSHTCSEARTLFYKIHTCIVENVLILMDFRLESCAIIIS